MLLTRFSKLNIRTIFIYYCLLSCFSIIIVSIMIIINSLNINRNVTSRKSIISKLYIIFLISLSFY